MMPAASVNRGLSNRRHVLALMGLLGLGTLVQAVVIGRATVPSLDAVRFARTARTAVEQGPLHVIRWEAEQPLFPLWVAAVHETMAWHGGEFPSIWAASTQVAAAIPLVLTVVPIYFLLLRLFNLRIALVGAGLFCVLPEVRRLGADGISDSTHLFFLTVALWTTVEYWTARARTATGRIGRETAWLALAGFFTGLAVLVRAEAVILPIALLLTISLEQVALAGLPGKSAAAILRSLGLVVDRSMRVFRAAAGPLAIHVCGAALVLVPYLAMAGAGTPQAAVARVLGRAAPTASETKTAGKHLAWQTPEGRPLHFAVKEGSIRQRGLAAALGQYGKELAAMFSYGAGALALWALWRHCRELTRPADRFLQGFFLVFSVAVIGFVAREGYL
ncbi:MAG: glycosyltransferase family 39 protein, partial [Pirellulales bacterium]|nr:glycosyltransferase family 39 protein [Pirellulales bacterium]